MTWLRYYTESLLQRSDITSFMTLGNKQASSRKRFRTMMSKRAIVFAVWSVLAMFAITTVATAAPDITAAWTFNAESNEGNNRFYDVDRVYIAGATPTVTGISPTSANRGTTITAYVYGDQLPASGAQVAVAGGGTTIYATSETYVSPTTIRCTLSIPSTSYVGYYSVYVQNPGMTTWVSKASAFRVIGVVTPTVTGISPTSANRGTTITAYIYGTNFQPPALRSPSRAAAPRSTPRARPTSVRPPSAARSPSRPPRTSGTTASTSRTPG